MTCKSNPVQILSRYKGESRLFLRNAAWAALSCACKRKTGVCIFQRGAPVKELCMQKKDAYMYKK